MVDERGAETLLHCDLRQVQEEEDVCEAEQNNEAAVVQPGGRLP